MADLDTWASLLWPWLAEVDARTPHVARPAQAFAAAADRAGRVDTSRVIAGTMRTHTRTITVLTRAGLMVSLEPGAHRIVLPATVRG